MTSDLLTDILSKHAPLERDGETYRVPSSVAVSVYVGLGSEPLIVERIDSITLDAKVVIVDTSRSERFFFAYDDVIALRLHEGK